MYILRSSLTAAVSRESGHCPLASVKSHRQMCRGYLFASRVPHMGDKETGGSFDIGNCTRKAHFGRFLEGVRSNSLRLRKNWSLQWDSKPCRGLEKGQESGTITAGSRSEGLGPCASRRRRAATAEPPSLRGRPGCSFPDFAPRVRRTFRDQSSRGGLPWPPWPSLVRALRYWPPADSDPAWKPSESPT